MPPELGMTHLAHVADDAEGLRAAIRMRGPGRQSRGEVEHLGRVSYPVEVGRPWQQLREIRVVDPVRSRGHGRGHVKAVRTQSHRQISFRVGPPLEGGTHHPEV